MKKILLTAAAALAFAAPLAAVPASAQGRGGQYQDDRRDQYDRQESERYQRGEDRANRAQDERDDWARDRRGRRAAWRDARREARWDESRHNGYYQNSRWHYGPPQADYYGRRGVQLDYRPWSRGQRLGYYNTRYQEVDYRAARDYRGRALRQPPRGYRWVRDNDGGDYLLAALAGGLIAQVVLSSSDRRY